MKKRKYIIIVLALITFLIFIGISIRRKKNDESLSFILPQLILTHVQVKHITAEKIDIDMDLLIRNSSPFSIHIDSINYSVFMAGRQIMKSRYIMPLDLQSGDSSEIKLPAEVWRENFERVTDSLWLQHQDSTVYEIHTEFYINLPFLKNKPQKITIKRNLPVVYIPAVSITKVSVKKAGIKSTDIDMKTVIYNKSLIPVSFADMNYSMTLDDKRVMQGFVQSLAIPAQDSVAIVFPFQLSTRNAIVSIPDALFNKSDTQYRFYAEMRISSGNDMIENSELVIESLGKLSELKELMGK